MARRTLIEFGNQFTGSGTLPMLVLLIILTALSVHLTWALAGGFAAAWIAVDLLFAWLHVRKEARHGN